MTEALDDQIIEASDELKQASQYLDGNSGDDADIAKSNAAPMSEKSPKVDRTKRLQAFLSRKSKSISIRKVKPEDKEDVRRIVRQLHEKTIFGHLPFSDTKFDKQAEEILKHPLHMIGLVAERIFSDGRRRVVGFAWASAGTYIYSDEGVMATCHVIAVESILLPPIQRVTTFLMILNGIKTWSITRTADGVFIQLTRNKIDMKKNTTHLILESQGINITGYSYVY